ncbi:MAG: sigma-70 family RNA polymerase sigma factor [Planctomycetota bacterium]
MFTISLLSHAGFVRGLARALLDDRQDVAEDVSQEVLLTALERRPYPWRDPRAWLAQVTRNKVSLWRRGMERQTARERSVASEEMLSATTLEKVEQLETHRHVVEALSNLREPYRTVIMLRFFDGLPRRRIAVRLGIPPATVSSRLQRALDELRRSLDSEYGGDRCSWRRCLLPLALPTKTLIPIGSGATLWPAGIAAGVLSMSTQVKLLVFAIVLAAALGGAAFLIWSPDQGDTRVQDTQARRDVNETQVPQGVVDATLGLAEGDSRLLDLNRERIYPPPVDLSRADRDRELFGQVVDCAGRPVPGALVQVVSYPGRRLDPVNDSESDEAEWGPRTVSAVDGTFVLKLTRGQQVDLHVTAEGFAPCELPWCQAGEKSLVVLQEGVSLEVTVKNDVGAPVPDCEVNFWMTDDASSVTQFSRREATTGPTGTVTLADLPPGSGRLRVAHPTQGMCGWPRPLEIEIPEGSHSTLHFEVTLPRGRSVSGRVVDAESKTPIAGAHVGTNWLLHQSLITGPDGSFTLRGWNRTTGSQLHVLAQGYARQARRVPPQGEVIFELVRGDRVSGRVLSATHMPVYRARVTAFAFQLEDEEYARELQSARSDEQGKFSLVDLRRDLAHTLVIEASGHARLHLDFDPHPEAAGQVDLGDIVLPVARRLEGRVFTTPGIPVPDVLVILDGHNLDRGRLRPDSKDYAVMKTNPSYFSHATRRTDDLGRFRFSDLAPGVYEVTPLRTDVPYLSTQVQLPEDKDILDLVLRLDGTGRLAVLVTDANGQPLSDAAVVVTYGRFGRLQQRTDTNGWTRFTALRDLPVRVRAAARGYIESATQVAIPQGQELRIALHEAARLDGVVLDPAGEPLLDIRIDAIDSTKTRATGYSDDAGRFTVWAPRGIDLRLRASKQRRILHQEGKCPEVADIPSLYHGELANVVAPASGLVLRTELVARDRTIEVRVVDSSGKPLPSVQVMALGHGYSSEGVTADDGTVVLTSLPSVPVSLRALVPDYLLRSETTIGPEPRQVLPNGQRIELQFREGVLLEGSVVGPNGEPVPGASVTVTVSHTQPGVTEAEMFRATSDQSGQFKLAVAPARAYSIRASHTSAGGLTLSGECVGVRLHQGPVVVRLSAER